MPSQKKRVDKWFSLFVRLRDSIEYCERIGLQIDEGIGQCCTCSTIKQWRYMDCGHFISRGSRGASGVRWDERNAHLQCNPCNAFHQGQGARYYDFMLHKYGQNVIDQLKWLDKNNSYKYKLIGLELYYKQKYEELVKSLKGR